MVIHMQTKVAYMRKKEIMSAIVNLANYVGLAKPWILEENLQSLHYEDNKILGYLLSIILISTEKGISHPQLMRLLFATQNLTENYNLSK